MDTKIGIFAPRPDWDTVLLVGRPGSADGEFPGPNAFLSPEQRDGGDRAKGIPKADGSNVAVDTNVLPEADERCPRRQAELLLQLPNPRDPREDERTSRSIRWAAEGLPDDQRLAVNVDRVSEAT